MTNHPPVQKVHGLEGELVSPDWTPLTLDEIDHVLCAYPVVRTDLHLLSTSPRPFSAAGVVSTRSGPLFIKRHARTVRRACGLFEEHRFLAYLRSRGAPVPEVLRASSGQTALESGPWTYEVHQVPAGIDLYGRALSWTPFLSIGHAWSAGRMLASIHRAAEGFHDPSRRPQPLVSSFTIFRGENPRRGFERYLALHPGLEQYHDLARCREESLRLLTPYHEQLLPLLRSLPPLWTHNDLHGSNLLWSGSDSDAEAVAIIDFGLADRTNAVYDIAQAIDRNIVEWLKLAPGDERNRVQVGVHLDQLEAMLSGYEEIRPFSRAEAAALAPMMALGHAEYALSEADYFYNVLHSEERTALACDGYLCGHARWFLTAEGRGLLEFLAQRAGHIRMPREA